MPGVIVTVLLMLGVLLIEIVAGVDSGVLDGVGVGMGVISFRLIIPL